MIPLLLMDAGRNWAGKLNGHHLGSKEHRKIKKEPLGPSLKVSYLLIMTRSPGKEGE